MMDDVFRIAPVPRGRVHANGSVYRGRRGSLGHVAAEGNACLYAFGTDANDYVKIGFSKCPAKRLQAVQTGSPFELFLLFYIEVEKSDVRKLEKAIHSIVPRAGGVGRGEWWRMDHQKVASFFLSAAKEMEIEVHAVAGGMDDTEPEKRTKSVIARNGGRKGYFT